MAGYSGTPLLKKLGYREGQRALYAGVPIGLRKELVAVPFSSLAEVAGEKGWPRTQLDVVHIFTDSARMLAAQLACARKLITANGMIWVSWPKKASKVPTDITEQTIRDLAFPLKLVDVKVCAVDDVWSGLKLVVPVKDRATPKKAGAK